MIIFWKEFDMGAINKQQARFSKMPILIYKIYASEKCSVKKLLMKAYENEKLKQLNSLGIPGIL